MQRVLNEICSKLVDEAVTQRLSGDNVTCLLILFTQRAPILAEKKKETAGADEEASHSERTAKKEEERA